MTAPDTSGDPHSVCGREERSYADGVTSDLGAHSGACFWAELLPYDGPPVCARFANVRPSYGRPARSWHGPRPDQWTSSLDRGQFEDGVRAIRAAIADGDVYQVNL